MRNLLVGSNQFVSRYKEKRRFLGLKYAQWRDILWIVAICGYIAYFSMLWDNHNKPIISPLGIGQVEQVEASETSIVPLADPKTQNDSISIIKKMWGKDWETGVAIAKCESGLRPNAFNGKNTNGTWDAGLFQVNQIHQISKENLFNPYANAGYAYFMFKTQGFNPWLSSNGCHHLIK